MTPPALTLMLVLVGLIPVGLPYVDPVTPAFAVIAVYYWSIYRPEYLPAGVVFVLGLVQDALGGTPLGMSSLVLLAVLGVGVSQRRVFIGKSVLVEWWDSCWWAVAPSQRVGSSPACFMRPSSTRVRR